MPHLPQILPVCIRVRCGESVSMCRMVIPCVSFLRGQMNAYEYAYMVLTLRRKGRTLRGRHAICW